MSFKNLRTLTRKSRIGFGPFKDCTVDFLFNMHRQRYMRGLYYTCSMISFMDDILDDLDITEGWRIEKPGIDQDLKKEFFTFLDEPSKHRGVPKSKAKVRKQVYRRFHNVDFKASMQARNQGKY